MDFFLQEVPYLWYLPCCPEPNYRYWQYNKLGDHYALVLLCSQNCLPVYLVPGAWVYLHICCTMQQSNQQLGRQKYQQYNAYYLFDINNRNLFLTVLKSRNPQLRANNVDSFGRLWGKELFPTLVLDLWVASFLAMSLHITSLCSCFWVDISSF